MFNRKRFLFLCLIGMNFSFFDALGVEEHTKLWTSYDRSGSFSQNKKMRYYIQPQLRFIDNQHKYEQTVVHAGLGHQTTKKMTLWLGGSGIVTKENSSGDIVEEFRLWQQLSWDAIENDAFNLKSRTRLEERKRTKDPQWAQRLREKLTLNIPFSHKGYYLAVSDEMFFDLNHPRWVSKQFFSQNRAFLGVGFPLMKKTSLEIGYLNQYLFNKIDSMSNIAYFGIVSKGD